MDGVRVAFLVVLAVLVAAGIIVALFWSKEEPSEWDNW